jgi:hypothetical protein
MLSTLSDITHEGIPSEKLFFFSIDYMGGEWWVEYFVYYLSILENGTKKESFLFRTLLECEVNQSATSSGSMNHPTNLPG